MATGTGKNKEGAFFSRRLSYVACLLAVFILCLPLLAWGFFTQFEIRALFAGQKLVPGNLWPTIWCFLSSLCVWAGWRKTGDAWDNAVFNWLRGLASFGFASLAVILCLAETGNNLPAWFSAAWPLAWLMLAIVPAWRSGRRPPPDWTSGCYRSGVLWFAIAAALSLVFVAGGWKLVTDTFQPIEFLFDEWLDMDLDPLRAITVTVGLSLLFAAAFIVGMVCLYRENGVARKVALPALVGLAAMLVPANHLLSHLGEVNPDTFWIELDGAWAMLQGSIFPPIQPQLHGGAFISSLFFRLFGLSPLALNLLDLLPLLACGAFLALLVRILYRDMVAVISTVVLAAILPMSLDLSFSWWFCSAAALITGAVAAFVVAARRNSTAVMILGILLAQCAFEMRIEAVVLFPLFYLIEACYAFPHSKSGKWVTTLFIINLIRMPYVAVMYHDLGGTLTAVNAAGYSSILHLYAPWLAVSPIGLSLALRRGNREVLIPAIWTVGLFFIYLFTYTAPSHQETWLFFVPVIVLAGGVAAGRWFPSRRKDVAARALVGGLAAIFCLVYSWQDWLIASSAIERKIDNGRWMIQAAKTLPSETMLLLEPVFLAMTMPDRPSICFDREYSDFARPTASDLIRATDPYQSVACFNKGERLDVCCYLEISSDGPDPNTGRNGDVDALYGCWPASILGRRVTVSRRGEGVRLLMMTKNNPGGP